MKETAHKCTNRIIKHTFLHTAPTVQIHLYSSLNRTSDDHIHHNCIQNLTYLKFSSSQNTIIAQYAGSLQLINTYFTRICYTVKEQNTTEFCESMQPVACRYNGTYGNILQQLLRQFFIFLVLDNINSLLQVNINIWK